MNDNQVSYTWIKSTLNKTGHIYSLSFVIPLFRFLMERLMHPTFSIQKRISAKWLIFYEIFDCLVHKGLKEKKLFDKLFIIFML